MIQANKGNVLTGFHRQSLEIRAMELQYFTMVFEKMSTVSSLLAGFASSAMMLSVPRWENPWVVVAFLVFTGSALGLHLMVILIATLCCLWGPGKALRGDDGSHMHEAIGILEGVQQMAMRYFVLGLFCFFISSVMVSWLFFDRFGAALTTIFMMVFLFMLVRQSLVIRRAFITTQPFTTGYIRGDPVRSPE